MEAIKTKTSTQKSDAREEQVRRYHPTWHCPSQKLRTSEALRRILTGPEPVYPVTISDTIVSPERWDLEHRQVKVIFGLLEDWFLSIEDGRAINRLPDPSFVLPDGRPGITEELVEQVIAELDRELDLDAYGKQGEKFGANQGCGFHRLHYPQKLALTQQLMELILSATQIEEISGSIREEAASTNPL